jgi:hypothetical protein
MKDKTTDKIQKMLAPDIPMPEKLSLELDNFQARNLAFLLQEPYSRWSMELDHYTRHEDVYPAEVLELLETLDVVRDQLVDQGIEWDPEA